MKAVFLDTVGLLAIWDADDQWHQPALVAYRNLTAEKAVLVTTSYVIAECGNAAARRPYRQAVANFRRALEVRNQLVFPNVSDWLEACARYEREREGATGLVDQLSFAVMRRLGLERAFTNDRHFREAGFETLF